MTKHYFKAILISLLSVAAWSQTAVADEPPPYGNCGDGVVEVNPEASTEKRFAGTTYRPASPLPVDFVLAPKAYFYIEDDTNAYTYKPLGSAKYSSSSDYEKGKWPLPAGEMCDEGPNSVVLCSRECVLVDKFDIEKTDINNNAYIPNYKDSFLNLPQKTFNCYKSGKCGPGVGNGIIQPDSPFYEECDDGNINAGDGCSPLGKIELTESYIPNICGNGIKENGESCDDGNIRNGDGCSSTCQEVDNGICTIDQPLCGNGRVDYAFGEQCDEGQETENCRDICILQGSPSFDINRFSSWGKNDLVYLDRRTGTSGGSNPVVPGDSPIAKVSNHSQKLKFDRDGNKQFSGVFLTGQKIKDIDATNKFKDGKIHFNMVISQSDGADIYRWDDDAFGVVFGIKEGLQSQYSSETDYKYLMLSWRSLPPVGWGGSWVTPGCNGDDYALRGKPGLRLYQVTGVPSYTQLWTMDDKCDNSNTANIKEIRTDSILDWTIPSKKKFPWVPGDDSYNKVINPFLPLNTFYAFDFGFGQPKLAQRLQIDIEFSKTELKVWVNKTLAIHVTKAHLPPEFTWPTEGEVGFYFMGMDNLTVDTSGYYSHILDNVDTTGNTSTVCSSYCGNGIVEHAAGETCDDGNTNDGDGCSSTCTLENNSGLCREYNGEVLCYGGTITGPKDGQSVKTKNPTISGTYVGDPADIKVTITKGTASCEGSVKGGEVKKNADGTWAFNKDCNLADGEHEVTADFVPTQSTQGINFPIIKETSTFTVDSEEGNAISLQVDQPAGDKVLVSNGTNLPVSGTSDNADTIHVEICEEGTSNCSISKDITPDKTTGHGSWANTIDTSSLTEGKHYTIKFTATKGSKESQTVTKNLEVKNVTLNSPDITNIKVAERPKVIPNADGTITIEGKEPIPDICQVNSTGGEPEDSYFDPAKCPQIYVTIEENGCNDKVVVKINKDGSFRGDVPLCTTATGTTGTDVTINAKASDSAGNVSGDTQRTVKIVEKSEPKILITCPKSTSTAGDCLLLDGKSGGMGLVVNGESNIKSERPVTVTAYPKNGEKCDFDPAALGEPVGTITTTTTPEGKWAVDFKHVKSGDYCIVAKLTTKDGKNPVNTTTANGYERRKLETPDFVDNPTKITEDIYDATGSNVSIRVAVDLNSNIAVGDECEVSVAGKPNWKGTGVYRLDGDQYVCDAQVPVTDPDGSDKKLVGETLVAKSVPTNDSDAVASQPSPEMQLPTAKIVKDSVTGKVNVEIDPDFPGAAKDADVIFNVSGSNSSLPQNKCKLTKVGTVFKCKESPVLRNDLGVITEIDADTTVTASLGGNELEETVTIDGNPTIKITCPNTSTASGTGTGCQLEDGSAGNGYVVKGKTSISAIRDVKVKVYKKENGTCDKSSTALRDETIETGTDGVWFYNPNLKGLPSGEYCVVATLIGNNNKTATEETTITYTRPSIDSNRIEFADDSQPTDIAEASIRKDSTVPVTVKPAAGDTNIIKGDKCVITVKDGNSVIDGWGKEGVFDKDSAGDLICTVYLKTEKGSDTLLGKTLVATAVDQGDPSKVSVAVEEAIPGKPTLSIDPSSGKAIINIDKGYPGAGEGRTIEIKIGTAKVGECKIEPGTSAGKLVCKSLNPIEKDGKLLKDAVGDTTITATFTDPGDPNITSDVSYTATGKKIGITCAEGSGCDGNSGGLDVTGALAEAPGPGETVKVTVYEKDGSSECSASQHGAEVASKSSVDVTDKTWTASFDGLQSGEYCVVAELLNSNNAQVDSAAEVATFNRTANIDSNDTVAFVDPDQQPANIAKAVVDGDATVPVKVKPGQYDTTNIIAGDKCIVYVKSDPDWKGQGTFEKVGDELTCTADLDTKNSTTGESLLGKKLIAKGVQKDGDDTTTTGPSAPLTIPGKPTIDVNPTTGKATITIPKGYPGGAAKDGTVVFKDSNDQEVGRCTPLEESGDSLTCTTTVPLTDDGQPDGTKLIDKTTATTVVPYIEGNAVPGVKDIIPAAGQLQPPTIADSGEIAKKVIAAGNSTVSIVVEADPNSNIKENDKCEVHVDGDPSWKSNEASFTLDNNTNKFVCTVEISAKNGNDDSLLGKTLVATATAKGNPNNTSSTNVRVVDPGKPTMLANPDGSVTITIPDGYPSPGTDETIVIKEGEEEVGRCKIKNGDAGNLICKTKPLTKNGVLLKDNVASSTEVTATFSDGSKETTVTANIPGVAQESTPTIADDSAAIGDKIKAAKGGPISIDVQPSENSNIKEGDKCEVYVEGDSNWKAEGTFQTVNGKLVCTAEGLKTVNGDKELYGKKLVAKAIAKNNPNNVSTPSQSVTVPDKEVTNPDDPGQDGDKQDGTYTEKGDEVIVKIPRDARGLEVGNKLLIKNSNDKKVGECTIAEDWTCPVTKHDDAGVVTKDLTGTLLGPDDQPTKTTIALTPEAVGFVAGGCSTTDSPESGLLALLFAALGFFGIRRRRD